MYIRYFSAALALATLRSCWIGLDDSATIATRLRHYCAGVGADDSTIVATRLSAAVGTNVFVSDNGTRKGVSGTINLHP